MPKLRNIYDQEADQNVSMMNASMNIDSNNLKPMDFEQPSSKMLVSFMETDKKNAASGLAHDKMDPPQSNMEHKIPRNALS